MTTVTTPRIDVCSRVTNSIVEAFERGVRLWLKPWNVPYPEFRRNSVTVSTAATRELCWQRIPAQLIRRWKSISCRDAVSPLPTGLEMIGIGRRYWYLGATRRASVRGFRPRRNWLGW